ncbi:MAG: mechanosensitive ion channel [Deltaproteobacteria bacterium]|nr:mechanosensitive ion channel [Deltaproteobacteria bacterium]
MVITTTSTARSRSAALLALIVLALPATAWAQDAADFGKLVGFVRLGGVLISIVIVLGSMVVLRVIEDVAARASSEFATYRPTIQKVESATRFAVYIATTAICMGFSIRLDPTALTVIGGALAFAIGFAMRDLVAAFIAGITIMFDRPFQVGDRVAYAGEYGDVIKIGLRSVQINTLDHNIVTVPNNKILTDVTSSGNYGELEMQVAMDFFIGIDQDARRAAEIIKEACLTSPYVFLDRPVPVLAKQVILHDFVAVALKARPYVFDVRYEKPFETDVHFRVLEAFREAGIAPPAIIHRSVMSST